MKSRKLLALFLAIFMLASLIVPASAEITPDVNDTNKTTTIGYDASLVEKVDLSKIDDITTYDAENPKDAYKITNVEGWAKFDSLVDVNLGGTLQGKTVYLATDLDFKDATITPIGTFNYSGNNGWNPYSFSGVFDGQGHTIKNVTIEATAANEVANGFFGLFNRLVPVSGAACGIKNLIIDSTVKFSVPSNIAAYSGGGCLVGTIQGANTNQDFNAAYDVEIYNVCNKADMSYSSNTASGLIAFAKCCKLTMTNCENQGDLTYTGSQAKTLCSSGIGGLLGSFAESAKAHVATLNINNCRNTGNIKMVPETAVAFGKTNIGIGGLMGDLRNPKDNATKIATISNSINNGNVTVGSTVSVNDGYLVSTAGILGLYTAQTVTGIATIDSCINYGKIVDDGTSSVTEHPILPTQYTGITPTNCTDATGAIDFTYNMVAKYYQKSNKTYKNAEDANDTKEYYSLRLVALHNMIENYDSYEYTIAIQYGDKTVTGYTPKLTSVNTSIAVDTMMGDGVTVVTAAELGAEYVSAVCIDYIPVDAGELTITITPKVNVGANPYTATPITFTVPAYNA